MSISTLYTETILISKGSSCHVLTEISFVFYKINYFVNSMFGSEMSIYYVFLGVLRISRTTCLQPDIWSGKCKFFGVYTPYKESISKEMNNNNDLNLPSMTKLSGWLRYCVSM